MRTTNITIGLIIFFALISCKSKQTEYADKLVILNIYERDNKIRVKDSLFIDRTIVNDTMRFIYKMNTDTLGFSFRKSLESDSAIFIFGQVCPLIACKIFKISNQDFTVLKYYYDEENTVDEETSFFFNQDYGLLVVFNDGWGYLSFSMEYDNTSKILIDSIISDRTGFYIEYLPPPPLPSDSVMHDKEEYQ